MDKPQNKPDELIARFFSRTDHRALAKMIGSTYSLLIHCARVTSRISREASNISEDDLDVAHDHVESNRNNDLSKACKLFDFVRLGDSDSGSRLHATRMIGQLLFQSPKLARQLGKSEQDIQNLVRAFFEFRACCLALLQQRHSQAHDSETRISFTQVAFLASCVTRSFELSQIIHSALNREFAHLTTLNRYSAQLQSAFAGSYDSEHASQEQEPRAEDPLDISRLLREIVDGVKPLNDAMETISEEHSKTFANLDALIQSGHVDLAARISAIEDRLSSSLPQAAQSEVVSIKNTPPTTVIQEAPKLSKLGAEQELVSLRDNILNRMRGEISSFQPYHNVLQRPLINAALKDQCRDLNSFKRLKEFQTRMNRNSPSFAEEQFQLFGQQIDDLLKRIDYAAKTEAKAEQHYAFDDDIPF